MDHIDTIGRTGTTCHAFRPIPNGGVNLCTLLWGHNANHYDHLANKGWSQ